MCTCVCVIGGQAGQILAAMVRHVSEGYMHVSISGADVPVGLSKGIRLAAIVELSRVRVPCLRPPIVVLCRMTMISDGLPAHLDTNTWR